MPSGATLVQREARPGRRDPARAGRRPLADARPRDTAHQRSVPRPDRRDVQRVDGRVPHLGDRRADGDRRPLRRAERRGDRRVRRHRLRREHPPALVETVERLAPRTIALNYSDSDAAADGLTHGLWRLLQDTFAGHVRRAVQSSEAIVNALRGRKSPDEVERIRGAIARDRGDLRRRHCRAPARPERARDRRAHARRGRATGLGYAWGATHCPAVNAGPEKDVGHSPPGELTTSAASCCTSTSASPAPTTAATCSGSGTSSTTARPTRPTTSSRLGRAVGVDRRRRRGAQPGRRRLGGRRRCAREPHRGRLSGADVRARPPARPLGARRRHRARAALGSLRRRAARRRRGGERLHARVRHGRARPRLHRPRGRRGRHGRRHRVALDAAARALARRAPRTRHSTSGAATQVGSGDS